MSDTRQPTVEIKLRIPFTDHQKALKLKAAKKTKSVNQFYVDAGQEKLQRTK